jgi:hypothetical protein
MISNFGMMIVDVIMEYDPILNPKTLNFHIFIP